MEMTTMETDQTMVAFVEALKEFNTSDILNGYSEDAKNLTIPHRKQEDWKYTNASFLKKQNWDAGTKGNLARFMDHWLGENAGVLVFENGELNTTLSTALNATTYSVDTVEQTLDWRSKTEVFSQLNAGFKKGQHIAIPAKTVLDKPIYVVEFGNAGTPILNSLKVSLGAFAEAKVVIVSGSYHPDHFNNHFGHFDLANNAKLNVERLQIHETGKEIASENVYLADNCQFHINTLTLDGSWVRNNLNIHVKGQNSFAGLNGVYLLNGNQHVDNHTMVDHSVPHCESSELYKGIAHDTATAVFNGKVFVRKDAQKTNAFQQNANILMSPDATVNSKPELEIYADDVKCSHGSTTGQFDEEAVFYLRSRGIGEKSARELLVQAFAGDVLDTITVESIRTKTEDYLGKKFAWN